MLFIDLLMAVIIIDVQVDENVLQHIYYRQKVFTHSLGYRSLIAKDSGHGNST